MIQRHLLSVMVSSALTGVMSSPVFAQGPQNAAEWYETGAATVDRSLRIASRGTRNSTAVAKNVILFVGDGMGVSTVTAARIFDGQQKGSTGEENYLYFERFPHLALVKTYNTNQQTPDSAGTMTAMMTGIKTKAGIIGVDQSTTRGDCDSQKGAELTTALEYAEMAGMATGVVSTARLTHATPAATYAKAMDRNYEDDRDASRLANPADCKDIARQLIEFPYGDGVEVALGGGRRNFIPRQDGADPEGGGQGEREDLRNLTEEWVAQYPDSAYVWNTDQFDAIDTSATKHLLGLFDMSHMEYEYDRGDDVGGEPSIAQMTEKAIEILQQNEKGFFLHVESGRIDHAHHATNPKRAMVETVAFAEAVKTAAKMTSPRDTLILVTADHSHVFTLAGYPTRGNPILGKVVGNDSAGNPNSEPELAADDLPYTTVGYTNGRGFYTGVAGDDIYGQTPRGGRFAEIADADTTDQGYHPEVAVPASAETHSAEDIALYARGPGSSLVRGTVEQNVVYHVMNQAARLERRARRNGYVTNDYFGKEYDDGVEDDSMSVTGIYATPDRADSTNPDNYGWVIFSNGTKQWIDNACRMQLEGGGVTVELKEWADISAIPDSDGANMACDMLVVASAN